MNTTNKTKQLKLRLCRMRAYDGTKIWYAIALHNGQDYASSDPAKNEGDQAFWDIAHDQDFDPAEIYAAIQEAIDADRIFF